MCSFDNLKRTIFKKILGFVIPCNAWQQPCLLIRKTSACLLICKSWSVYWWVLGQLQFVQSLRCFFWNGLLWVFTSYFFHWSVRLRHWNCVVIRRFSGKTNWWKTQRRPFQKNSGGTEQIAIDPTLISTGFSFCNFSFSQPSVFQLEWSQRSLSW